MSEQSSSMRKWWCTSQAYCTFLALVVIVVFVYASFSIQPTYPTIRNDYQNDTVETSEKYSDDEARKHNVWKTLGQWWYWTANDVTGFYTFILSIFTGILSFVAALQAILFVWQLMLIKRSTQDAKTAANAAASAAGAAIEQARIMRNAVHADIHNIGKGVAFIESYNFAHEICRRDKKVKKPLSRRADFGRIIISGEGKLSHEAPLENIRTLESPKLKELFEGRICIFFYGYIRYSDIFGIFRRTGFIFRFVPDFIRVDKISFVTEPNRVWWFDKEEGKGQNEDTPHGVFWWFVSLCHLLENTALNGLRTLHHSWGDTGIS